MRVLVTGGDGFVGRHLTAYLAGAGHATFSYSHGQGFDVRDYEAVRQAVVACEPDRIFHLAAVAWPGESIRDPGRVLDINIGGTYNVLEAVRRTGSEARLLITGTSEEYGYRTEPGPLTETTCVEPTTPYGISKLGATLLGQQYAKRYGLHVVCTRAWNHTGPYRQAVNAESAFARRIVAVERGESPYVTHGDLSAVRNFTDVRDMVKAYTKVIECEPGVYNVCHPSQNVTMSQVMQILIETAGSGVTLKPDPALMHPNQEGWTDPSCDKLRAATGWEPEIPLSMTLDDLLQYWRNK
jgi:GDP-4-dehydro-6-deoxy-D-mannose reductase